MGSPLDEYELADLPLSKCEAYNRVYDQPYELR